MKILIVDDSNFSQLITSNLIKKFIDNVEVYLASNGEEGFEKYKEINPDYIFVDLLMPKLNGKELIKLIREYDKNVKIIVISADVQKTVREEVEQFDIMAFINKPFNQEKAETICEMMRKNNDEK